MNTQIRQLAIGLLACFTALFIQLNLIQVFKADSLNKHPNNTRQIVADFNRDRGRIETVDGLVLARTIDVDGGNLEKQREYTEGELFAPFTGFFSFHFGSAGAERAFNEQLVGDFSLRLDDITGIFDEEETVGNVRLTVNSDLQRAARDALGQRNGSVVVLEPSTGAVRAMWSYPSYDPNQMSLLNRTDATEVRLQLLEAPGNPLLPKAYRERYFPGSTFKMVTAAAVLSNPIGVNLESPAFADDPTYLPPKTTKELANFGGNRCGGPLIDLIRRSCNTGFAELGAEFLGPAPLIDMAEDFGFNRDLPFDLPDPVTSNFPDDFGNQLEEGTDDKPGAIFENTPALAQASIGQNEVQASPLHMAMIAGAIANDGKLMVPRVLDEVVDSKNQQVQTAQATVWRSPIRPIVASDLRQAMVQVVEDGTGQTLQIDGVTVGAKTGTAELGGDETSTHSWVIAFAGPPGEAAQVAVAVLVEAVPGGDQQTGGEVAGPVAKAMIEAALR